MKLHDRLIKTAEKDLYAARTLFEKESYPQAIFFFQQSVEKANKAFGLMSNKITENMLQNEIGHKPLKIHITIVKEQKKNFENYKKMFEQNLITETNALSKNDVNSLIKSSKKFIRITKKVDKEPQKHIRLSTKELDEIINFINDTSKEISEIKVQNIKINDEKAKGLKSQFIKTFANIKKKYPLEANKIKQSLDQLRFQDLQDAATMFAEIMVILIPSYHSLLLLALIMHPHATTSRYPSEDGSPEDFYNIKLPLVKKLPELLMIQEKAIDGIKSFQAYSKKKIKRGSK